MRLAETLAGRAPRSSPLAHALAQKALRDGLLGLTVRARKHREAALRELEKTELSVAEQAATLLTVGLSAHVTCSFDGLSTPLTEAAERSLLIQDRDQASLALLLHLEALCACGNLEKARADITTWASERVAPQVVTRVGQAVVKWGLGELDEALELFRSSPAPVDPEGLLAAWRQLLEAEILLEKERAGDATTLLDALLKQREKTSRFDEVYMRARALSARRAVESLWQNSSSPEAAELPGVERELDDALGYLQNAPRYGGLVVLAQSQLETLQGRRHAEKTFHRAMGLLEASGAKWELGKALGRQARFLKRHGQKPLTALMARSRDVLSRVGADRWMQALEGPEGAKSDLGTSLALSRSIVQMKLGDEDDVELKAVFEVNRAISSLLELAPLLQKILREVVRVFKAERGALLQQKEGRLECVASLGVDAQDVIEGGGQVSFSVIREAIRSGQVLLSDNAQLDGRFQNQASVMSTDIRSVMCAPLSGKTGNVGVLYLDSRLGQRIFKPQHRELLEVFATQAATAIENAQAYQRIEDLNHNLDRKVQERTQALAEANQTLAQSLEELKNTQLRVLALQKEAMEKEMALARSLQEQIVPRRGTHGLPSARVTGVIETASQVGGDFWTYVPLPGGQTLLLIGDVTGHGVAAGMVTTVARAAVDTLTQHLHTFELTELIGTLSEVIHRSSTGKMTMTTFAVLLDPPRRTLTLVNAGHPHPFWLQYRGGLPQISSMRAKVLNSPLGAASGQKYVAEQWVWQPGDRLALYTDGLLEGANASGKPYGLRRIQKALVGSALAPLEEQLAQVMADGATFFGDTPRADDLSLVLLELL